MSVNDMSDEELRMYSLTAFAAENPRKAAECIAKLRRLLVRMKMYVPDTQQDLHAQIHHATEK